VVGTAEPLFRTPHLDASTATSAAASLGAVNAVLLSSAQALLALPYIAPHLPPSARLFATEPALSTAHHYVDALLQAIAELTPASTASLSSPSSTSSASSIGLSASASASCSSSASCTKPTLPGSLLSMAAHTSGVESGDHNEQEQVKWFDTAAAPPTLSSVLAHLPSSLRAQVGSSPALLRRLYTRTEARAALERVQPVSYGEQVRLSETSSLLACAHSSGHSLGSCVWRIFHPSLPKQARLVHIAKASAQAGLHPRPLDTNECLHNADALLLTGVAFPPPSNTPDRAVSSLCTSVANTLSRGGSVLLPVPPGGITFDLLEAITSHLQQIGLRVPVYWIGPTTQRALAYANIAPEWVCKERQERIYEPRPPFPYLDLMASGALGHFASTYANPWIQSAESFPSCFHTPCVALAGHTSLRCGQVLHFLNAWKHDPRNLLVLTDPQVDPAAALSPHLPFAMQVTHLPVDSRLSARDATSLLRAFRPRALVIPAEYETAQPGQFTAAATHSRSRDPEGTNSHSSNENGSESATAFPVLQLRPLQSVSVATASSDSAPAEFVSARLSVLVAQNMALRHITSEVGVSPLQAMLLPRDGELILDRCEMANTADAQLAQSAGARLWGTVDLQQLLQRLNEAGIAYAQIQKEEGDGVGGSTVGWRIMLPSLRATIHIAGTSSRIEFAAGLPKSDHFEETHQLLLSAVVDQLNNLASQR